MEGFLRMTLSRSFSLSYRESRSICVEEAGRPEGGRGGCDAPAVLIRTVLISTRQARGERPGGGRAKTRKRGRVNRLGQQTRKGRRGKSHFAELHHSDDDELFLWFIGERRQMRPHLRFSMKFERDGRNDNFTRS